MSQNPSTIGIGFVVGLVGVGLGVWAMVFAQPPLRYWGIITIVGAALWPVVRPWGLKIREAFGPGRLLENLLVWGLAYWAGATLAYSYLLYRGAPVEVASLMYHAALFLLPVALILARRETPQSVGFVLPRERAKEAVLLIGGALAFVLVGILARAALAGRPPIFSLRMDLLTLVLSVLVAPLTEETLWRGLLQGKLQDVAGDDIGLWVTAGLYSLMHLPRLVLVGAEAVEPSYSPGLLDTPLGSLAFLFGLGIVLGFARERTRSIWVPIVMHGAVNLLVLSLVVPR